MSTFVLVEIKEDIVGQKEVDLFRALDAGVVAAVQGTGHKWSSTSFFPHIDQGVARNLKALLTSLALSGSPSGKFAVTERLADG